LAKVVATDIVSATDILSKFRKQSAKFKRIEEMIQNSPKRVSETLYFIISVDFTFMELTE